MEKITTTNLIDLGFENKNIKGCEVFLKGEFLLKKEYNCWLIISDYHNIEITGLSVISTIEELKKYYFNTFNKNL